MAAASCSGTSSRTIGEGAGLLDRQGVGEELAAGLAGLALDAVAAELVDRLRRQADVAHDRDAGPDDRLDGAGAALAAFELDRPGAALAHQQPAFSRLASGVTP